MSAQDFLTAPLIDADAEQAFIERAYSETDSPFDYIIVGSGAGGGPLASRLALAKKKVLLIEAGGDPKAELRDAARKDLNDHGKQARFQNPEDALALEEAPLFHGASTEDPNLSWQFSVRHYADNERQVQDHKYDPRRDPIDGDERADMAAHYESKWGQPMPAFDPTLPGSPPGPATKGGIFYKRSSGIGGCTGHHAMIVIKPNDHDWDEIAKLTNDSSWSAKNMQPYFARMEQCLYVDEYGGFLSKALGWFYKGFQAVMRFINPKALLDEGGHGKDGWQPTSFISLKLVQKIVNTDRELTTVLIKSAFKVIEGSGPLTATLKRFLITLGFVRALDPNDDSTRANNPKGGVFLIPIGTGGGGGPEDHPVVDEVGKSLKGCRVGVREFILKTAKLVNAKPEKQGQREGRLVIEKGVHVKRVIFDNSTPPRAIGVIGVKGDHLYRASPKSKGAAPGPEQSYFVGAAHGEVILCGGAFNTPQLLMLSGIGPEDQLKKHDIKPKAILPGVGRNLQDRYEVTVVSELTEPLKALETISFDPASTNDELLAEWRKDRTGLYTSNGGTLCVLQRSTTAEPNRPGPDFLSFGAPAAFRGYYWNYSKQLLRPYRDAPNDPNIPNQPWTWDQRNDQTNLWTWVILKAYTRNNGGTVQLRSDDPFDTPEINFHSFDSLGQASTKDWEKDVEALAEVVASIRKINRNGEPGSPFKREIQPKEYLEQHNMTLSDWIKSEAWGHHACGTCRIGSDPHRQFTNELIDQGAVLDSHFRVHGVNGLRVVDASVFPKIPGYFILAPIFMVSEKAADTILKECSNPNYPDEVRDLEMIAVRHRRAEAQVSLINLRPSDDSQTTTATPVDAVAHSRPARKTSDDQPEPENLVGLAISGGGVRSATFALGVIQALAAKNRLRQIDFMSTISGGGFIGSFLGRLFMRDRVKDVPDHVGRAQDLLKDNSSGPIRWLRTQGNYLFASGANDWLVALGVFFRNLFAVHLVVAALLLTCFGILAGVSKWSIESHLVPQLPTFGTLLHIQGNTVPEALQSAFIKPVIEVIKEHRPSAWWWLPVAVLGLVMVPMKLGYWLAPKAGSYRSHPFYALLAWLVLIGGSAAALTWPGQLPWASVTLVVLALSWLWQEVARHGLSDDSVTERRLEGMVVRNRLSRGIGETIIIFVATLLWVGIDTVALAIANTTHLFEMITALLVLAPALQLWRKWALAILPNTGGRTATFTWAKVTAVAIALALIFVVDVIAHTLFKTGDWHWAWGSVGIACLFSLAIGRAFDFLNLTSLHTAYAARLARTYLGASNEARYADVTNIAADVSVANPHDDIFHYKYRPEEHGGPLHLINVCVNETVDHASQREIRGNKGILMTIGSFGVSVGRRYFATWSNRSEVPKWLGFRRWLEGVDRRDDDQTPPSLQAIRLDADPNTFHPLARRDDKPAVVQSLSLADWTAISGAAFSTGTGRNTSPLLALFMGLINLRLGFWWDSGILATERPGRFPGNLWRRLQELPGALFRVQNLLLSEWRGRFDGPSREFWNLSDGGHIEQSGVYELLRRRLSLIICTDAMEDPEYTFKDMAILVRLARVDFGVEIAWLRPTMINQQVAWISSAGDAPVTIPPLVTQWIELSQVGALSDIHAHPSGTKHAALAHITYPDIGHGVEEGWLLVIKASLTGDESLDVTECEHDHPAFPQDPTTNQVFDDQLWESYRQLGQQAAETVIK